MQNRKSTEYKLSLFQRNETILKVIYYFGNGIMLKEQIVAIVGLLEPLKKNIENSLKELVAEGFLKDRQVLNSSKYALYLTKFPQSVIEGKKSGDVTSVKPTEEKILNSLLRAEYLIVRVIPAHLNKGRDGTVEGVINTLKISYTTILKQKTQAIDIYALLERTLNPVCIDTMFKIDKDICMLEKLTFLNKISKTPIKIPQEYINSYNYLEEQKRNRTDLALKQDGGFYNFKNMLSRGFSIRGLQNNNANGGVIIKIDFLDFNNSITVEKLYKNIGLIYIMFTQYLNVPIKLEVYVHPWNKKREHKLIDSTQEKVKDFGENNFKKYTKGLNALINACVPESNFKDISVKYINLNLDTKYGLDKKIGN